MNDKNDDMIKKEIKKDFGRFSVGYFESLGSFKYYINDYGIIVYFEITNTEKEAQEFIEKFDTEKSVKDFLEKEEIYLDNDDDDLDDDDNFDEDEDEEEYSYNEEEAEIENMRTKAELFEKYEEVRTSGKTNMYDVKTVGELSELDKVQVYDIMKRYEEYKNAYFRVKEYEERIKKEHERELGILLNDEENKLVVKKKYEDLIEVTFGNVKISMNKRKGCRDISVGIDYAENDNIGVAFFNKGDSISTDYYKLKDLQEKEKQFENVKELLKTLRGDLE